MITKGDLKIPADIEAYYQWSGDGSLNCTRCGTAIFYTWQPGDDIHGEEFVRSKIAEHKAKCTFVRPDEIKRLMK